MKHNIRYIPVLFAILVLIISVDLWANRKQLSDTLKPQVLKALQINERLHSAFFTYNANKVEAEAKQLKAAIEEIKDEELANLLNLSKTKLSEITAKTKREKNNEAYDFVSKALIHIVKTYDVGKYNAYSCPMVKKVWVQNSTKQDGVQNPYAPEMPACGTKDTSF